MVDLNGYISYRAAKQILDARFKTTEDEIALWVSGVGGPRLDAYIVGFSGVIPFLANGSNPFGSEDYISPLEELYFLPGDIEQFQPTKRFISWNALIERWIKYNNGDIDKTKNFINRRAKGSNLLEHHPVTGGVESSEGESFERGLFDLDVVKKIEIELEPECQPKQDDENKKNDKVSQGKRDKQITTICKTAEGLGYTNLLSIPEGGKTAIKTKCLEDKSILSESAFEHAWKEANKRKLISMADKEKYLSNQ